MALIIFCANKRLCYIDTRELLLTLLNIFQPYIAPSLSLVDLFNSATT